MKITKELAKEFDLYACRVHADFGARYTKLQKDFENLTFKEKKELCKLNVIFSFMSRVSAAITIEKMRGLI